ncbi:MAG: DUF4386 domain-containing protein [Candidatus Tyrphobacter sp.]
MEAEAAQRYARTGGWLYALLFVAGSSLFIQSGSIISGNAAATAHNIEASSQLWRIALAAEIVMYALDVPLAVIFYVLMRPVNNGLALASSAFRFAEAVLGCTIALLNAVPLYVLNGSAYLKAIGRPQLDALAYVSLKAHGDGAVIALLLFGIHCVLLGYLVFRSGYLPKALGLLLIIAGLCYATHCTAQFVAPAFDDRIYPWILLPGFPAEVGFCLWLIFAGVNRSRWNERTRLQSAAT